MFSQLSPSVKQYLVITGNYWAFTLTDGALRMLVVLYFHQLGYTPLAIAMLFLFYEIFGVVTNLIGGWLGARIGLNKTMQAGLMLQVLALAMLAVPENWLTVAWVMFAQALSGIAKDLNKMSAKSSIKTLVPKDQQGALFKWVAILTGSKNTLKGVGFFLGGLLLSTLGFKQAIIAMAVALALVTLLSQVLLKQELGKAKNKPKFSQIFSKNTSLNYLSAARLFLFAARDIWFVVALPVFLASQLGWQHHNVGTFMAAWVIVYGFIQAATPKIAKLKSENNNANNVVSLTAIWGFVLALVCFGLYWLVAGEFKFIEQIIIAGLMIFGAVFAVNSALHSYVIVAIAKEDGVSMDVGFYYMANAMGRLLGTVLSGYIYQAYGLAACILGAAIMAVLASGLMKKVELT